MKTLLLEIGTEEIPAGYIDPALAALAAQLSQKLREARIEHGEVRTLGTPRRLAVTVAAVAARQLPRTTEIVGPPKSAGIGPDGKPTMAAVKFAAKAGVPVERLKVAATPKGEYLAASVTEPGQALTTLLREILPAVILALPFPKSMRWADLTIAFARPIASLLCLYGESVVSFALGPLRSGRTTFGHRFMHPRRVKIDGPEGYVEALREAYVIVDPAERRALIAAGLAQAAASVGGRVLPDEELLATVTHLVEFPTAAVGRFAPDYLELPDEVLITAMREHQKYFAVVDAAGRLMPHFIAVSNTPARDMAVVTRGLERVLRARLEDAKFFYHADKATPLDAFAERLKNVLFQAQLGSLHDKSLRVARLAVFLSGNTGGGAEEARRAERAARLCKADLVSHMVGEFPKLQGVMGRVYAALQGEPEEVAAAIEEHYRPVASGAALPESRTGALVAVADKLDTICGCFHAGLIPTGAADPYALRRQAIGVLQILRARRIALPLAALVAAGLEAFAPAGGAEATAAKVLAFFESRAAGIMAEEGFDKDTVAAVLGAGLRDAPSAWLRAEALQRLKRQPGFEPIAVAFKRVVNIIRKAGENAAGGQGFGEVDAALFEHPAEGELLAALGTVEAQVEADLGQGRFDLALGRVAGLRPPVDRFFDDVMVMAEEPRVRRNRLALLARIAGVFERFADFSKLATA
jgi:glycyl-tRNA synthetase beta chain